jgi:RimJ/RimL family protein N-acetyltransferase
VSAIVLDPVALEGTHVRLEPLTPAHVPELAEVGLDPEIWRWNPRRPVASLDDMAAYVEAALRQQAAGHALPFATRHLASARVVGSTRFHRHDLEQPCVEIGYTWVAPAFWRTTVNTEAKYLMLRHAFERLGCVRVEFKTDALNARSRAAIARLGAKQEGTLRAHMRTASGRLRDSVYFSLLASEWPEAKKRLEERLAAGPPAS